MNAELAARLPKLGPKSFWNVAETIIPGNAIVSLYINGSCIRSRTVIATVDAIAIAASEIATIHKDVIAASINFTDHTLFGKYTTE